MTVYRNLITRSLTTHSKGLVAGHKGDDASVTNSDAQVTHLCHGSPLLQWRLEPVWQPHVQRPHSGVAQQRSNGGNGGHQAHPEVAVWSCRHAVRRTWQLLNQGLVGAGLQGTQHSTAQLRSSIRNITYTSCSEGLASAGLQDTRDIAVQHSMKAPSNYKLNAGSYVLACKRHTTQQSSKGTAQHSNRAPSGLIAAERNCRRRPA